MKAIHLVFENLKILGLLTAVCFIVLACKKSFLPQDIEPPEVDDLIVVQAYVVDSTPVLSASASVSLDPFQRYDTLEQFIGTSEILGDHRFDIQLFKNQQPLGALTYQPFTGSRLYATPVNYSLPLPPVGSGDVLRMEVSHPEYGEVWAQQQIPTKVPLQNIEYLGIVGISEYRDLIDGYLPLHGIRITLNDPLSEENFYQISLGNFSFEKDSIAGDSIQLEGVFRLESDEPELVAPVFNASYYFSDQSFNGQSVSFIVKSTSPPGPNTRLVWRNISRAWFRYTLSIIDQHPDNSFLALTDLLLGYFQFSSVESNIEGGLGCFCAGTEELYEIEH